VISWYEPIEDLNVRVQPFVTDLEDLCGYDEWHFRTGKGISNWPKTAWIKCSDPLADGPPDDALRNHLGLPVFSQRLQEAIQLYRISGIQFLPIQVYRSDDSELPGYAIANLLNLCPALDRSRSDYDVFEADYFLPERRGQISGIRKAVLLGKEILNKDVIRLSEFPAAEFVSPKFVDAYRSHRCSGYIFRGIDVVEVNDETACCQ
jgi:hypothetical protein